MQYIFPAAEAAQDLQRRLEDYLRKFDNPLIKAGALQLEQGTRKDQLVRRAKELNERVQHVKFCLSTLVTRTPNTIENRRKHEVLNQLWDQVERFRVVPEEMLANVAEDQLETYCSDMAATIENATKYIRISRTMERNLKALIQGSQRTSIFTTQKCLKIIEAIVQDELDMRMRWKQVNNDICNQERVLREVFPDWDGLDEKRVPHLSPEHVAVWREECEGYSAHFYRHVLEPVIKTTSAWVHTYVPNRSWRVWHLRKLGNDIVLERGEDFRILDWEQRMQSGEWNDPLLAREAEFEQIASQCLTEAEAAEERAKQDAEAGFAPNLFQARLTDRPVKEIFHAAPEATAASKSVRGRSRAQA